MSISQKDLQKVAAILKTSPKVIFMVGAGISTGAGIPDFRSPKTGLYHNLQSLDLPYAEAVFDISFFKSNPKPFYTLAKELYPGQYVPTKFHFFMKLLQEKKLLHRVYTQNIDTLERVAGVEADYIVEAHGSFAENHCIKCHKEFSGDDFKKDVFDKKIPRCKSCKGLVKPDIVFFGEGLPERFFNQWEEDLEDLESAKDGEFLTITAGTSLTVYPFASLPSEVPKNQKRVLVNKERVGDFKSKRENDVVFLDDSDEFVESLCDLLGWRKELDSLIAKGTKDIKGIKHETAEEKAKEITEDVKEELEEEAKEDEKNLQDLTKDLGTLNLEKSRDPTSKSI